MLRRQALRAAILTPAAYALSQMDRPTCTAIDFNKPVPAAQGLTAYHKDGGIQIRMDNLPLLVYRAQSSLKYPYFSPLNGPVSGLSLVAESAEPYPHHRGLWLGCDPVNGGNYWADNGLASGQILSTDLRLAAQSQDQTSVSFTDNCEWRRPGGRPLADQRRFTVTIPDKQKVFLDCHFIITALEDVSIKSAKHSFFAMRAAADISPSYGGQLVNSEGGAGAEATYGKPAAWCGFFGKRRMRPDTVEGIVIMNHPNNFGGNCPWFTRDYGHLSPSPLAFLDKPWTLAKGALLELKYRVVLCAGTPQHADLAAIYRAWVA